MFSMTGIGKSQGTVGSSRVLVQIKSINHRYCEVFTRLPSSYQGFEISIQQLVKKNIARGKVELLVTEDAERNKLNLNKKALKEYYQFLCGIKKQFGIAEPIGLGHIQTGSALWLKRDAEYDQQWPALKTLVDKALASLTAMRKREGLHLKKIIMGRLAALEGYHARIMGLKTEFIAEYQVKLKSRIEKILGGTEIDQAKLANEVAFLADRSDISEELERLVSHFKQMKMLLHKPEAVGRSLDFLIQEMNREWNTIGSKSQNIKITHDVVEAKSELEKIREQIQNIE